MFGGEAAPGSADAEAVGQRPWPARAAAALGLAMDTGARAEWAERLAYAWPGGPRDLQAAALCGGSFWGALALGQAAGGLAGVSCASGPVASSIGAIAVLAGGWLAERSAVLAVGDDAPPGRTSERVITVLSTLSVFQALGGRFCAVLPSDVLFPGAFAKRSIPATSKYASLMERQEVQAIGRKSGCHTCGTRFPRVFHADHMPPIKLCNVQTSGFLGFFRKWPAQEFYPQCGSCSRVQSRAARISTRKALALELRYHFSSLRAYHASGLLVGMLAFKLQEKRRDEFLAQRDDWAAK